MTRLLIADHHPIVKEGLEKILYDLDYLFCGVIADGERIADGVIDVDPDILILEIDLPNSQGLSTIKLLRKAFQGIKILVYSCHPEEMYALSAIKAGAMGYVSKTASIDTVKFAIERVKKGGIYINDNLVQLLSNTEVNTTNNLAYRYKKLSSRETEVLNMLSSGKRNKDIAEELSINEKTVSTYKTRLLKKLDAGNLAELIQQARLLQTSDL